MTPTMNKGRNRYGNQPPPQAYAPANFPGQGPNASQGNDPNYDTNQAAGQQAQKIEQDALAQGKSPEEAHQVASQFMEQNASWGSGKQGQEQNAPGAPPPSPQAGGQPPSSSRYGQAPAPTSQTGKYTPGQESLTSAFRENRDQAKTNSDRFGAQGDAITAESVDAQNRYGAKEDRYGANADDIAAGIQKTPGYTADEAAKIGSDFSGNKTSQSGLDDRQLRDYEQQQIAGNPWQAQDYLNVGENNDAVQSYGDRQREATAGLQEGLKGAVDNSQIRQSPGYGKALSGALGSEESKLNSAIDPSKLSLDPSFAGKFNMSDGDVRDLEDKAGRGVGNRYQAQKDDIQRRAAADGNTSPMAIAAMNEQLSRDSGVQSADAMTDARIAARGEQAGRLQASEGMRLGTQRDISGRVMDAATTMGKQRTDAATQQENLRQRGETSITGNEMEAAKIGGQAAIDTAYQTGKEATTANEWGMQQGIGIAEKADQASSDRNKYISGNRQDVTTNNQNTQFNQGMATQQATAQGAQAVADARRGGTNTVLNYNAGQQREAQQGSETARGQQIQGMGVTGGLQNQATGEMNQATSGGAGHSAQPGIGQQIGQGILGAAIGGIARKFGSGGVVNKPTLAVVGEKGPEMVIPLDPGKDAKLPPGMAMKVRNRYRRPSGDVQKPTTSSMPLTGNRVYR